MVLPEQYQDTISIPKCSSRSDYELLENLRQFKGKTKERRT